MINRITLSFNTQIEKDFEIHSRPQNLREFNFFIFMCFVSSVFKVMQGIIYHQYLLVMSIVVGFLAVLLIRVILIQKPQWLQIFLVLIQLGLLSLYNINTFRDTEDVVKFEDQWQIGFEAAVVHIYVYLLGTNFLHQSIALILVFGVYMIRGKYETASDITFQVEFLSIILGILNLRYQIEINKRQQYLEIVQNNKWQTVTQMVLDQWVILVKYDVVSEQLQIEKCSGAFRDLLGTDINATFRKILRDMTIYDKKIELEGVKRSKKMSPFHSNLEKIIRHRILGFGLNSSTQQYDKYNIYRVTKGRYYEVVIMDYYCNCEQMVFVAIHENKSKEVIRKLNKQIIFNKSVQQSQIVGLRNNFSQLIKLPAIRSISNIQLQSYSKNIVFQSFWQLSQLNNMLIWNIPDVQRLSNLQVMTIKKFKQLVCNMVSDISCHQQKFIIYTKVEYVQRIMLNMIYFSKSIFDSKFKDISIQLTHKPNEIADTLSLTLKVNSQKHQSFINGKLKKYLSQPIEFTNLMNPHINYKHSNKYLLGAHIQKCQKMLQQYHENQTKSMNAAITLVITKYLLTQFGATSSIIYYHQNQYHYLQFELINMNNLPRNNFNNVEDPCLSGVNSRNQSFLINQNNQH